MFNKHNWPSPKMFDVLSILTCLSLLTFFQENHESIGEYRAALEAYRKAFEIFQEFGERRYSDQLNEAIERVIDKLAGAANQEA